MNCKIEELMDVYNDIRKSIKNKHQVFLFEINKMQSLTMIKEQINNGTFKLQKYNIFVIKEPKLRVVMSESIINKIANHYFARYILIPKLSNRLSDNNFATRKNMGVSLALNKLKENIEKNKKYGNYYFLKMDITKYFYNIDHQVLKDKLKKHLNAEEFAFAEMLIDSTNNSYINEKINKLSKKYGPLPNYQFGKGLGLGSMASQFFAIFYLSDLHHFITHNLKIKCWGNYMDDTYLIHPSKEYLENCLKIIEEKLQNEYYLSLNKNKTLITSSKQGLLFLNYKFKIINKKTVIKLGQKKKYKMIKNLKERKYLYETGKVPFDQFIGLVVSYKYSCLFPKKINSCAIINKYYSKDNTG